MKRNKHNLWCIILAVLIAMGSQVALAQDEWAEEGRNELGLYLGMTASGDDEAFSIGIDYERRLSLRFGIGGVVEHTGSDFRENVIAVSFDWHPWKELKVFAAPGLEIEDGETGPLLRLGAEYGIRLGKGFEISPGIAFDLTEEENAIVIGAAFTKKF